MGFENGRIAWMKAIRIYSSTVDLAFMNDVASIRLSTMYATAARVRCIASVILRTEPDRGKCVCIISFKNTHSILRRYIHKYVLCTQLYQMEYRVGTRIPHQS